MSWGPRAIIDSSALRHNLGVVRRYAPRAKVMAIIKANAYGHGLAPTARALIGADAFGVARLAEGLALRDQGLGQRIVLLEGVFTKDDLDIVAAQGFEIVVHTAEQVALLLEWRGAKQHHVWIKVDTGMNRLGFRIEDFPGVWQALNGCRSVAANPKLMTHLASADERDSQHTDAQVARFRVLVEKLGVERSAANSAGLLAWPQAHMEWVRPGVMLYGVSPFADGVGAAFDLRPAMTLSTRLIAVRLVKGGERVGYGGSWTASADSRIGIAAIGYGDGYPRQIGSGSPVLVRGKRCAIAGRVSMDMIAIDLAAASDARVGDEVTLWGQGLPVEEMATCAGTIPYELICGISQRVTVEYR
ncbi:MAG TPA: alanine racemase [Steroidobacteraceae bacterium]|nr:alanine racemase [Steroidobacteraceae bacterium]